MPDNEKFAWDIEDVEILVEGDEADADAVGG